ncbi:MAG: class I SAM-dependent methyltransferase [Alphaproteobacteria bacterium]|jgi:SAM-dependent methyltransferase|nr:class I SAM-dependent methyltransferase [Alphaproteobacteria bacterium]
MPNIATMYDIRTKNISYDKKAFLDLVKGDVLEVGSGTGRLISIFRDSSKVKSYSGIELNKDMVDIAKKKYPKQEIINGDFLKYDFKNKFDSVLFSFNVINEFVSIDDKIKALRKAIKLLKGDGEIILSFSGHDFESWGKEFRQFQWKIMDDDNEEWNVSFEIKRNLLEQLSLCNILYQKDDVKIKDSYINSLMTRNELLILFKLLDLKIISEFFGKNIDKNSVKYPELGENILYVLKNNGDIA